MTTTAVPRVQPGMVAFTATVYEMDHASFLGVFADRVTAVLAVHDWVVNQWVHRSRQWVPWVIDYTVPGSWRNSSGDECALSDTEFTRRQTAWFDGKDADTVIRTYFEYWAPDEASISEITVK